VLPEVGSDEDDDDMTGTLSSYITKLDSLF
jgi:hypothetical protein